MTPSARPWLGPLAAARRCSSISSASGTRPRPRPRPSSPGIAPRRPVLVRRPARLVAGFSSSYSTRQADTQRPGQEHPRQRHQQGSRHNQGPKADEDASLPVGISPWARFMDVLKSEYAKSQEMQENVRELTGTAQGLKDSEAAQKMRQAYTALRLKTLIQENPKLAAMASRLSSTGRSVSDAVNHAAKEIDESRWVKAAKRVTADLDKRFAEPIRHTKAYKVVEDTVDFSQGALRYGGYIERAERIRRRNKRLERLGKVSTGLGVPGGPGSQEVSDSQSHKGLPSEHPSSRDSQALDPSAHHSMAAGISNTVSENPSAAPALVLHATANQEANDSQRKPTSRLASITPEPVRRAWANFREGYQDSDNPLVASLRTVTGAIGRFFDETETAKVVRMIKEMDPDFEFDGFLRDLREYIVPEIVDAYVDGDLKGLKLWTSEGAYNVITAPMLVYMQRGLRPESQVIDLKGIDIMSAKVLQERELPVFVISFRTHEINCYTNPSQDGQVEVGDRDEIQQVQYVIVMTRESDQVGNEVTGGWKLIDMARRGTVAFL